MTLIVGIKTPAAGIIIGDTCVSGAMHEKNYAYNLQKIYNLTPNTLMGFAGDGRVIKRLLIGLNDLFQKDQVAINIKTLANPFAECLASTYKEASMTGAARFLLVGHTGETARLPDLKEISVPDDYKFVGQSGSHPQAKTIKNLPKAEKEAVKAEFVRKIKNSAAKLRGSAHVAVFEEPDFIPSFAKKPLDYKAIGSGATIAKTVVEEYLADLQNYPSFLVKDEQLQHGSGLIVSLILQEEISKSELTSVGGVMTVRVVTQKGVFGAGYTTHQDGTSKKYGVEYDGSEDRFVVREFNKILGDLKIPLSRLDDTVGKAKRVKNLFPKKTPKE